MELAVCDNNRLIIFASTAYIICMVLALQSCWVYIFQVPLFRGSYSLEKMASRISWVLGKTGRHLFLADSDNGKPPLLLQMVKDSEDLKFMWVHILINFFFCYMSGYMTEHICKYLPVIVGLHCCPSGAVLPMQIGVSTVSFFFIF